MGIGEIELLDDDSPDAGTDVGDGDGRRSASPAPAWEPPRRYRPWPPSPFAALTAVVVTVVAALWLAILPGSASGARFDLAVVSAVYATSPDEIGITLTMSVENVGASMVELTELAVAQPGLVPSGTNGGFMQAGLPVAVPPGQTVVVPLVFNFDCQITALPQAAAAAFAAGYDARGVAHTATLRLPASADPWTVGGRQRPSFCAIPAPHDDLNVGYGGMVATPTAAAPADFSYTILLAAPQARSITVASLTHDNPGIAAQFDPALPMIVLDGQTVRLTITWHVLSCALAMKDSADDGVQIMASNQREAENWDVHLGTRFARDMTAEIEYFCAGPGSGS